MIVFVIAFINCRVSFGRFYFVQTVINCNSLCNHFLDHNLVRIFEGGKQTASCFKLNVNTLKDLFAVIFTRSDSAAESLCNLLKAIQMV